MVSTGVLPFVRGVDFTGNDFGGGRFPQSVADMTGLRWLKLNRNNLQAVPQQLGHLQKLEHLNLMHNQLENVYGELTQIGSLRTINLRHNKLRTSGLPADLFRSDELATLDLSCNSLKEVPEGLEHSKSLLSLNLSHNQIELIPNQLFVYVNDLLFLDLSSNRLESLPPQTRRLVNLQTLNLADNPLGHFQMRQLPALVSLQSLNLSNTERTPSNLPPLLDTLTRLTDVDLSANGLNKVPDCLFTVQSLKRLNLSDNQICGELNVAVDIWCGLEVLNLCRNQLTALPASICKLTSLRRLFINENKIDFNGLPSGLGKLISLEVFSAAHNRLEMIPEGLCRCGSLKKLILSSNRLVTLPDTIHLISDSLSVLELKDNPDLVLPPRPVSLQQGSGLEFYNIDFSLHSQLRQAGAVRDLPSVNPTPAKDPIARKLRLRRRKDAADSDSKDSAKILKGMKDVAKVKQIPSEGDCDSSLVPLKPKKWNEGLEKPPLDYSEFFDPDVGQIPGVTVWEIENFVPNQIDECINGNFYEGDCYIVLRTFMDDSNALDWQIFFWIGSKATLDKCACSAIHAVNLRNFLNATARTIREEQGDESGEFLELFDGNINYIEGGRTASGFFSVEELECPIRLYRAHVVATGLHMEPVEVSVESLDPRHVFLLDTGKVLFIWYGKRCRNTLRSKTRLLAEKINKNERKGVACVEGVDQGEEGNSFWRALGVDEGEEPSDEASILEHVSDSFTVITPILYQVGLGMGYLELPQVEIGQGKLTFDLLDTKHVYILDCHGDVFVWIGKRSTRLVRAASLKLSQELVCMKAASPAAIVSVIKEGTESQIFKTKFPGWDEVISVDFTRTADSVRRTGADIVSWARHQQTKADLSALFTPRQAAMPLHDAQQLIDEWNEDLEQMETFVLEGKKFVRLPDAEFGQFYSGDCYVFLCRYWVPLPSDESADESADTEDDFQCVVYFWQGRDSSNMGWLTFTFSLQKKFKSLFGEKLEVVRMHQQQEPMKFMSHFKRKFVIRRGRRPAVQQGAVHPPPAELLQLRCNGNPICTRCVQVCTSASQLNSEFCFILKVPFAVESTGDQTPGSPPFDTGIVYVWLGCRADTEEVRLAEEIATSLYPSERYSLQVLNEGEEPENFFWVGVGGRQPYDCSADYMRHNRLFRCTNERGYFAVSEKCSDFCQDELDDDDIMILDNGEQVFLWLGSRSSEVEIKLAYKSVQVYIQHMRVKQPDRPRKLFLTVKGKESRRFKKCFHGWCVRKTPALH